MDRVEQMETFLLHLMDSLSDPVVILRKSHVGNANTADVIGENEAARSVWGDDTRELVIAVQAVLSNTTEENLLSCRLDVTAKDHSELSLDATIQLWRGEDFSYVWVLTRHPDVSSMAQTLSTVDPRFQPALAQSSSHVFAVSNADGVVTYASPSREMVFGRSAHDPDRNIFGHVHPEDYVKAVQLFSRAVQVSGSVVSTDVRIQHQQGPWLYCELTVMNLLNDPAVNGMVVDYHDISGHKRMKDALHVMKRRVRHIAFYDGCTNLPNHRSFDHQLDFQVQIAEVEQSALGIFLMELDGWTYINDTMGRSIGDKLLKTAAARLSECLAPKGFLAYIGGDQFALLAPIQNKTDEVSDIAQEIFRCFSSALEANDLRVFLTTRVGVSIFPDDGTDHASLLKHAGMALRQATPGQNEFRVFAPNLDIKTYRDFMMKSDIRNAIGRAELYVVYQPKVAPRTGKIVGAEALVRWRHPEWGQISPSDFVVAAEESGAIVELGEWVLRQVCMDMAEWHKHGLLRIPVAVNVSGVQLARAEFVDTVQKLLDEFELDSQWLELEITESQYSDDNYLSVVQSLQEIGIGVAIDDFGTGYSSLGRLRNMPAKTIKIDRSFIQELASDARIEIIIGHVLDLSHQLGIKVVAEGVETMGQRDVLSKYHCDEIQGYLYSRPVGLADFKLLLQQRVLNVEHQSPQIPNRRKYFRIPFELPLSAEVTITSLQGKAVQVGTSDVLINNIGPGGLCFLSEIRLPVNATTEFRFDMQIFDQIQLFGNIVWGEEEQDGLHMYGVAFIMDEISQAHLIRRLDKLAIQLRKHRLVAQCGFWTEGTKKFFGHFS